MAVTDEAITKIKEMLISGQLKAGDRLPPENELSDQLGLSRSSLREAVKALELIRVLDVRRGDGTYVTSLEPGLLTETMGFMVEIHQESSSSELLEVRRILEPGAAAHAAGRIDARTVASLRACLDAVPARPSAADLAAHDFTFHSRIARASGNPYLAGLLDSLTGSALRLRTWQRITEAGAAEAVLGEHAAILEALTLGDAELARSLMTVHVASAERWLRRAPAGTPSPVQASHFQESPVQEQAPRFSLGEGTSASSSRGSAQAAVIPTAPVPDPPVAPRSSAPSLAHPSPSLPSVPKQTPAEEVKAPAAAKRVPAAANKGSVTAKRVPAAVKRPESARAGGRSTAQEAAAAPSPAPSADAQSRRPAPQISRIAPEPALYELFAMPSAPVQKAGRKPRRPA